MSTNGSACKSHCESYYGKTAASSLGYSDGIDGSDKTDDNVLSSNADRFEYDACLSNVDVRGRAVGVRSSRLFLDAGDMSSAISNVATPDSSSIRSMVRDEVSLATKSTTNAVDDLKFFTSSYLSDSKKTWLMYCAHIT
eukprot:IDg12048t1